ncbi:MAG: hypothetical protein JNM36_14445 [Chitinophagales bacterium]|nr:hypothetical protein [Chitinophagales bacterium]HNI44710.1 hypothetical protein [Chitinophagales bacterium]
MAYWTIVLEDERKNTLALLDTDLHMNENQYNSLTKVNGFNLLCYLDPHGDVIFNCLQIDDLTADLQRLKNADNSDLVDQIISLAKRCKEEPHTYLTFCGD